MHVLQNELSIKEPTIIAKGTFYPENNHLHFD